MSTETTQAQNRPNGNAKLPTHVVKMRDGRGRNASFDRIGVAWKNEDGALYVKLHGTQIIDRGFTLYEIEAGTGE